RVRGFAILQKVLSGGCQLAHILVGEPASTSPGYARERAESVWDLGRAASRLGRAGRQHASAPPLPGRTIRTGTSRYGNAGAPKQSAPSRISVGGGSTQFPLRGKQVISRCPDGTCCLSRLRSR